MRAFFMRGRTCLMASRRSEDPIVGATLLASDVAAG
jgi:hypothetical protein